MCQHLPGKLHLQIDTLLPVAVNQVKILNNEK